jgi:putative hydrolase of the HAD superfamily
LDAASGVDDHEFSMLELGLAFLSEVGHPAARETAQQLVTTYVEEWNQGVHPIAGVPELIVALSVEHRLAIVTNTHDPLLVPAHLEAMHIASCFETVIASVEVGWRKPHPTIYRTALDALAADPADTVFVGDSKVPDYDGPRAAGMRALLIDPGHHHDLSPGDRLESVLDLPDRLMAR